jgi:hypothetical protein
MVKQFVARHLGLRARRATLRRLLAQGAVPAIAIARVESGGNDLNLSLHNLGTGAHDVRIAFDEDPDWSRESFSWWHHVQSLGTNTSSNAISLKPWIPPDGGNQVGRIVVQYSTVQGLVVRDTFTCTIGRGTPSLRIEIAHRKKELLEVPAFET